MSTRFYIAAPIFTDAQLHVVCDIKEIIEDRKHDVFSPWHNSREIWKGRAPADCTPEEREQVLNDNINYLDWCSFLVSWVGGYEQGYTDPGVIWEMGYAKCLKNHREKLVIAGWPHTIAYIHDDDVRKGMNLMLAGTVDFVAVGISEMMSVIDIITNETLEALAPTYSPTRLPQEQAAIQE